MSKKISKKKIRELTYDIIDTWDLDTLVEYAIEHMTKSVSSLTKEEFDEEWDNYHKVGERQK